MRRPGTTRFTPPPPTDGALALSPPAPARRPHLRLVEPAAAPCAPAPAAVRLIIEVLAGTCPPHRLARLATAPVLRALAPPGVPPRRPTPQGRTAARTRVPPPRVLAEWVQTPADGVAEAGAVVIVDGRVHALALRLELLRGRWRCTALETTALQDTAA